MIFEHFPTIIFSISLSTLPNQIKMKQESHIYIRKTMLCLEVSFFMIIVIWVVKENFHLIFNSNAEISAKKMEIDLQNNRQN
jgi:hypothetical protein